MLTKKHYIDCGDLIIRVITRRVANFMSNGTDWKSLKEEYKKFETYGNQEVMKESFQVTCQIQSIEFFGPTEIKELSSYRLEQINNLLIKDQEDALYFDLEDYFKAYMESI